MDLRDIPYSANIDDRRDSLLDTLMVAFRYPLRSQHEAKWPNVRKLPEIAMDFPMGPPGDFNSPLAKLAGYNDINSTTPLSNLAQLYEMSRRR